MRQIRRYWQMKTKQILCEKRRLSATAWQNLFGHLVKDIRRIAACLPRIAEVGLPDGLDPREPLIWAWCVLHAMPDDVEQRYRALRETSADLSGIEDRVDQLREDGYLMEGLPTAISLQIPWLAVLARTLDADLSGVDYWPEDIDEWEPVQWQPEGYECYVVPVTRSFRLGDGRQAQRRALRYHAILPVRTGSVAVRLTLHPDLAKDDEARDPIEWAYGAAIFPGLDVVPDVRPDSTFILIDAPLQEAETVLARQISQALDHSCDILAWPELTMPLDRLQSLKDILGADPLAPGRIPLIVAGSWHEGVGDGEFVNRCHLLRARGETLATYDKRRQFPWRGNTEGIRPGNELRILVMEDCLVGIAICRDLCDDLAREGYADLSTDLVLVPSMGDPETTDAHSRHCKSLRSLQGTVAVVVQQNPFADPAEPPGASFMAPPTPTRSAAAQRSEFRALPAREES